MILYTYKQVSNHGINHGLRVIMNLCPLTKKKNNLKHVYWSNIVKIGILNRCQFFLLHYNSNPRSYRQVSQITKQKQPIFDNVLQVFRRLVLRSNVSRFYLKYFFLLIYMHIFIKNWKQKFWVYMYDFSAMQLIQNNLFALKVQLTDKQLFLY